ncbi:hypothetical protein EJ04DRAFT_513126 [Polyplosphaeria fusca]|uniref:Uncharacterized protein n=1 Tax=Polyplosphaeria fusca TaxID=682080 RepID=A0A9P4QVT9_9PLEO|nr:hypothetical protein EJ04DRAFT_513126 [Polyplosphaeria fusca]
MKFLVHTGKYLWFLTVLLGCTATALCYTPDGSLSNDLSCDPTANESICCEMGFSCTSSRFCLKEGHANSSGLAFDGVYIRGTCTDSSWASAECGGNCVKGIVP